MSNGDPVNIDNAYHILCNIMESKKQRDFLSEKGYLKRVYQYVEKFTDVIMSGAQNSGIKLWSETYSSPNVSPSKIETDNDFESPNLKDLQGESSPEESPQFTESSPSPNKSDGDQTD